MRPQSGKQKIFDAALDLFQEQGYFATTIAQITKHAGVSKGLVYNYFESKDQLLIALLEDYTQKMQAVSNSLDHNKPIKQAVSDFINVYLAFLKNEKHFLKLQLNLLLAPELKQITLASQQQRAKILRDHVTQWFRRSNIAKPTVKARLFLALLDGVALHYLAIYPDESLATLKPQLIDSVHKLCEMKNPKEST